MVIVIAGPTASGKSQIALQLAKDINGVIINGDSRQVYKELQIGTARPIESEFENIPNYLYGHVSVKKKYNIYQYQKDVKEVFKNIPSERVAIIVGGTGLYIDSVIYNYILTENREDNHKENLDDISVEQLHSMIDPNLLNQLNESDIVNPVRLRRIVEKQGNEHKKGEPLKHLYFVIDIPKEQLHRNIETRVSEMFSKGLVEENKMIREKGLEKYSALHTIGYQEFDRYFSETKTLADIKSEIIRNTKKYAKRQKTWFRRNKNTVWTNNYDLILESSTKFIKTE